MNKLVYLPLIFITSCGIFTWQTTINTLDGYFFGYERDEVSVDEFLESQYSFVSIKKQSYELSMRTITRIYVFL